MTNLYRQDDPISGRWIGLGRRLTKYEGDLRQYEMDQRVATLEANYTLTISIDSVSQPTSSTFRITLTDASYTDITMPIASYRDRGDWAVDTPYLVNDTFNAPNGGLYRTLRDHTSDDTEFDPNANDGAGHDYYASMIPPRGNTLPAGGAVGMYFRKNSSVDYVANWAYIQASEVVFAPATGSPLTSTTVAGALEELASGSGIISAINVSFAASSGSALVSTTVAGAIEELEALIGEGGGGGSVAGLSDVEFYISGDPLSGQLFYFDGTNWTTSEQFTTGKFVKYDGSNFVNGSPALADIADFVLSTPADGHTLVYDGDTSKWVNRAAYNSLGSTGSDVTIGLSSNHATIAFTPSGNLQIANGGFSRPGEKTVLVITTSGTSSFNITAGASVKMNGTLATGVTSGKVWTLTFVADSGPNLYEIGRTGPM